MSDAAIRIANQKEGYHLVPVRRDGEPWLPVVTAEGKGKMGLSLILHVRSFEDALCALKRRVCGVMPSEPLTIAVFDVIERRMLEESLNRGLFQMAHVSE